jgi:hypothetical protein
MSDPQIPEALAPVVTGIVSLHDFRPYSMKMPSPKYRIEFEIVVPDDLATIYDLKPAFAAGYTGKGQTIAVIEDSNLYNTEDWNIFRRVFGLSGYTAGSLSTINPAPPHGTSNCADPGANPDDGRRAGRENRGGDVRRYHDNTWIRDRGAEYNQRQRSARHHQHKLRLLRSGDRSSIERRV